jgi:hypothetical protein
MGKQEMLDRLELLILEMLVVAAVVVVGAPPQSLLLEYLDNLLLWVGQQVESVDPRPAHPDNLVLRGQQEMLELQMRG